MSLLGDPFRFFSESIIEGDIKTPPGPAVKDRAGGDGNTQHLFQANGLGAKLDQVAMVELWLAPFVLHRKGLPGILIHLMELHHVGLANEAEL